MLSTAFQEEEFHHETADANELLVHRLLHRTAIPALAGLPCSKPLFREPGRHAGDRSLMRGGISTDWASDPSRVHGATLTVCLQSCMDSPPQPGYSPLL